MEEVCNSEILNSGFDFLFLLHNLEKQNLNISNASAMSALVPREQSATTNREATYCSSRSDENFYIQSQPSDSLKGSKELTPNVIIEDVTGDVPSNIPSSSAVVERIEVSTSSELSESLNKSFDHQVEVH